MTKSLSNIRIYGDETSAISVAPKGTTGPTGLEDLSAPHVELGWISEDGTEIGRESDSNEFKAWQGGTIVRTKSSGVKNTLKFQCLEETADVLGLYYPGSTGTTTAGISKIAVKSAAVSDERAWVADFFDGDVHKRYDIPRGEVVSQGTLVHKSTDMTVYEFEVTIYGDFWIITNNPAVDYTP